METENKNLTEEVLSEVSGGAGAAAGQYQKGDLVTVKEGDYYYFGTLISIEVYCDGDTRYVVQSAFMFGRYGAFSKVSEYSGTLRINPAVPATGAIIKKIYDFPEPGKHPYSYISKWVE